MDRYPLNAKNYRNQVFNVVQNYLKQTNLSTTIFILSMWDTGNLHASCKTKLFINDQIFKFIINNKLKHYTIDNCMTCTGSNLTFLSLSSKAFSYKIIYKTTNFITWNKEKQNTPPFTWCTIKFLHLHDTDSLYWQKYYIKSYHSHGSQEDAVHRTVSLIQHTSRQQFIQAYTEREARPCTWGLLCERFYIQTSSTITIPLSRTPTHKHTIVDVLHITKTNSLLFT